uniref:Uncharacterized protein n=1 Tax=Cacopsylla melanoneura TaxID=428564 RepID=A0A8D8TTV6_9HEMI
MVDRLIYIMLFKYLHLQTVLDERGAQFIQGVPDITESQAVSTLMICIRVGNIRGHNAIHAALTTPDLNSRACNLPFNNILDVLACISTFLDIMIPHNVIFQSFNLLFQQRSV